MIGILRLMSCIFLLSPSLTWALNFVRVSENASMTVYIDIDSIAKEGGYITANEIREYKLPMEIDNGKFYRSSLGLSEIDCKLNTSRVTYLDIFELNGLKGKRISHGVKVPMVNQIKPNSITADVRDLLCSKLAPEKI